MNLPTSNPKGIVSSSPGLRGTSYPGTMPAGVSTPTGLRPVAVTAPQPRWGCAASVRITQGSSFLATLGFETESLWDSHLEPPKVRPRGI